MRRNLVKARLVRTILVVPNFFSISRLLKERCQEYDSDTLIKGRNIAGNEPRHNEKHKKH